ncbi:MAG: zinc ribbon domain-containing protein [Clostridia bacterium]|nr:zinc ribbon domain-containing protein [Clostridia bacterium]
MKFCPECGEKIIDANYKFCTTCGARLKGSAEDDKKPPKSSKPDTPPDNAMPMGFFGMKPLMNGGMNILEKLRETEKAERKFSMTSSGGMMVNDGYAYSARSTPEGVVIRIRTQGVSNADALEFITDESFYDKLYEIMEKYNISSWDGFHGENPGVCDGYSFSLSAFLRDGSHVSAGGYMNWPQGYRAFAGEVIDLFTLFAANR